MPVFRAFNMRSITKSIALLLTSGAPSLVLGYSPAFQGYGQPLDMPVSPPPAAPTVPPAQFPASTLIPISSTGGGGGGFGQIKAVNIPQPTASATLQPGQPIGAVSNNSAPAPTNGCPAGGAGVMTWRISNNFGVPLSVAYLNNADSPSAIGCPGSAAITPSQTTEVVFPTGWAGRIFVGKEPVGGASLIEGSTTGANDIDVSYVDGFSVPISCGNDQEILTGCNINLWETGACTSTEGDQAICRNPTVNTANGPATPFFLPCQGAAYTFPNDNVANRGDIGPGVVTCCIGTEAQGCKAPARQGKGNNLPSKRSTPDLSNLVARFHGHKRRHGRKVRGSSHVKGSKQQV